MGMRDESYKIKSIKTMGMRELIHMNIRIKEIF